jgi:uncharacterized protein (DUF1015 family)
VPQIRPFRALRFDPATVGDPAAVVAPPCDAIDDSLRERLLARHPANVVRIEKPEARPSDGPDDRYRRAARALAEWRSTAILHKDPHPSIYVYEHLVRGPGTEGEGRQRGYFARLRLETLEADVGIVADEPAGADNSDERYKLLRATGVNACPVVGSYLDPSGVIAGQIDALIQRPADIDITADDGTEHRLWAVPADGSDGQAEGVVALLGAASTGPITIVAGQQAYDAALRYRDERRMSRSCEEDPAFDYVLTLFVERSNQTLERSAPTGLVINPHEW